MSKPRILLVDDEPHMIVTVKFRLEANGYEVLTAENGEEALATARAEHPDLILLDWMLPKMNGPVVCEALKQDAQYRMIPILMFTAKAQDSDRQIGAECGADGYVAKPFESKQLLDEIQRHLARAADSSAGSSHI